MRDTYETKGKNVTRSLTFKKNSSYQNSEPYELRVY